MPIEVMVPIMVRPKGGDAEEAYFRIILSRDTASGSGRPVFVREGITISDVRCRAARGVRSIVLIEDSPLARLLGDAENPAHTRWESGSLFKDKYVYGPSCLTYVAHSVQQLVSLSHISAEDEDPNLLLDFFSKPAEHPDPVETRKKKPKEREGKGPTGPVVLPPRAPQSYRISRISGGFRVMPGDDGVPPPREIEIRVAYDVRRGSALKNYSPYDFQMGSAPIVLDPDPAGARVESCSENHLVLEVTDPEFKFEVVGFDENRDLYIGSRARD